MHYLSRKDMLTKVNIRKNKTYVISAQLINRDFIILFNLNVHDDDVLLEEESDFLKLNKINNSDSK